jgi:hypothetical protein
VKPHPPPPSDIFGPFDSSEGIRQWHQAPQVHPVCASPTPQVHPLRPFRCQGQAFQANAVDSKVNLKICLSIPGRPREEIEIDLPVQDSVLELKDKISWKTGIEPSVMHLTYNATCLSPKHKLRDYGIKDGSKLSCTVVDVGVTSL